MNDPVLRMLGLARRAGKLAFGDELVREACMEKKARCVMAASDAGESTAKKAAFYAERANVPFLVLPVDKQTLGAAIGKGGCAVCAVTDIGLASAAVQRLAAQDSGYADVSAQLAEKNARIQSRRGKRSPAPRSLRRRSRRAAQAAPRAKRTKAHAQSAYSNRQPPQSGVCHQNREPVSRF